jgi:ArsR family transcriptional regulator
MKTYPWSCCSPRKPGTGTGAASGPDAGREAVELLGGIETLSRNIPEEKDLLEQSRRYNALSDPLRLTILYLLRDQPLCVCVINRFMQISGPKLSYHLAVLKESGLIEGECRGNWIYYSLTDAARECIGQ